MTPDPQLLCSTAAPGVLLLCLNRPERRNALATPLLCAVAEALEEASRAPEVRAVVLTGGDAVFAAGADIDELAAADAGDPVQGPRFLAWKMVRAFPKPLIAAVEGWCLGAGAELMMCCDIVVAGQTARFGLPETNLGIMPGAGGTASLPRRIGRAMAMRMVLTGEPIDASAACAAGLISEVVEAGQALDAAVTLAQTIAARSASAMQAAKASINQAETLSEPDHLLAERLRFVALLGTPDKIEGVRAFKEKRPAQWRV
ncbi:enoyl-CoA hydratase-related protein [Caulobacter sp. SSI4214]|uniref:enoyl-CoA hydratase-related protein n=1 Tax=Caulobacter sp. SSI4214 TaxID=2575739 RepID=UPI0014387132|nr:enoyl-CoA hydratase-related protein [Caulobacter sp. SSI4214]